MNSLVVMAIAILGITITYAGDFKVFRNQAYPIAPYKDFTIKNANGDPHPGGGISLSWDAKLVIQGGGFPTIRTLRPESVQFNENGELNSNATGPGFLFSMPNKFYIPTANGTMKAMPTQHLKKEGRFKKTFRLNINSQLQAASIVPLNPHNPGPYRVGKNKNIDRYDMRVFAPELNFPSGNPTIHSPLGFFDMRVYVVNPDTPQAKVSRVDLLKDFTKIKFKRSDNTSVYVKGIEPTLTIDGRLMFFNYGNKVHFSYNVSRNQIDTWTAPQPLTKLHRLKDMQTRTSRNRPARFGDLYRIANFPLRYPDGTLLKEEKLYGAYPWINLDGDDLFFSTIRNVHDRVRARVSLRAGLVTVGASTRGMIRNIDGGINRDRYGSLRLTVSSFGKLPGKWGPKNLKSLPLSSKPNTMPMFQKNADSYFEVSFYETLSESFDFYLEMSEAMERNTPWSKNGNILLKYNLKSAEDISGNFRPASINGANFSDEFVGPAVSGDITEEQIRANPAFAIYPDAFNKNMCQYQCDKREDRYSGKAMYFKKNNYLVVPLKSKIGKSDMLEGSNQFTIMTAIKPFYTEGAHSIMRMPGVFHLYISADRRLYLQINGKNNLKNLGQISANKWSHIALTYDGRENGLVKTYINGKISSTRKSVGQIINTKKREVKIGPINSKVNGYIYSLDQTALAPKILTNAQVNFELMAGLEINYRNTKSAPTGLLDREVKQPYSANVEVIALGKELFFDKRLSKDASISCASCHRPDTFFADNLSISNGLNNQPLVRHTPAITNMRYKNSFFHDGRASNMNELIAKVMSNPIEFGADFNKVEHYIRTEKKYVAMFNKAKLPKNKNFVFHAIAQFVFSLENGGSKDDLSNIRATHLTGKESTGKALFNGRARCAECHNGSDFSDSSYHNIGIVAGDDIGRAEFTGLKSDEFKFKTPSLRNIAMTAPYFHNGSIDTLEEVVELYNTAPRLNDGNVSHIIKPLSLNKAEVDSLVQYLKTLTGKTTHVEVPALSKFTDKVTFNKGRFLLKAGQSIFFGQNNEYRFVLQYDGNLVLYSKNFQNNKNKALWASRTPGKACKKENCFAVFQGDGNFVLYLKGKPYWHSKTHTIGQELYINSKAPYISIKTRNKGIVTVK